MTSPISAGDLCEVINGVMGKNSPNLGLIVKVNSFQGEDPAYGRIWRCSAEYAERWAQRPEADPTHEHRAPPGTADFAQSWLRKIEPPQASGTTTRQANRPAEITT